MHGGLSLRDEKGWDIEIFSSKILKMEQFLQEFPKNRRLRPLGDLTDCHHCVIIVTVL